MATDDVLPLLQSFHTDTSESTSIAQTASSSAGQYLGQVKSNTENDRGPINFVEMMQKLFAVQESK